MSTKDRVKAIVEHSPTVLASAFWAFSRWRWRNAPPGPAARRRELQLKRKLGRPLKVLSGPFAGMPYIDHAFGSALLPKLLGTYEREASAALGKLCESKYDTVVDIGTAEGYYAVGLGRLVKPNKVVCFEAHPH